MHDRELLAGCGEDDPAHDNDEPTIADLVEEVWHRRNQYDAAKRAKERADYALIARLDAIGEQSYQSDEYMLRATVTRRRRAKLVNEEACSLALNEIGLVLPRKEVLDDSELLAIADRYGGDFPGVEIVESESLRVTGKQR